MKSKSLKPLWICPRCKRFFANKNQWHSCVVSTVSDFLKGKDPHAVRMYRSYVALVRKCGPIKVHPVKTRIAFMVRMRFAGVSRFGRGYIVGGFILLRKIESPRFIKTEFIAPSYYVYSLRFASLSDFDSELLNWLREAYLLGTQERFERKTRHEAKLD